MNLMGKKSALVGLISAGALLGLTVLPTASALAATTSNSAETFDVVIGGQSAHGNVSTYNYYPDVVTVDAGDTVTWQEGPGVHTVLFVPSGMTPPVPGTPSTTLSPVGGKTYDGSTLTGSGLLMPGQTYSLTFTKPGTYVYRCGIHPDMYGVVVVQPAGTPRPESPSQVLRAGEKQLQVDLSAGAHAKRQAKVTTTPGAKGTTVYHVNTDLPSPSHWTVPLTSATGQEIGVVNLDVAGNGQVTANMVVNAGKPNTTYSGDVQIGSTSSSAPLVKTLNSVTTNSKGWGTSTTVLPLPPSVGGIPEAGIPGNIWFIDLKTGSTLVAGGQVNYPQFGALRYFPGTVTIHAGDSVIWTQNDFHELHTITILGNKTVAEADKVMPVQTPSHVVNSSTAFYNSGLLSEGQTYKLTFDKPGTYTYQCLLHNDAGMLGKVVVLPAVKKAKPAPKPTALHYVVKPGDSLWSIAAKELGNGRQWAVLYQANKAVIGPNANLLRAGEVLTIPGR